MGLTDRFSGIINNMNEYSYHILGCGAIGSSTAIQLARMGAEKFYLYDYDKVEEPNIGVSQYSYRDIGKPKVEALKNIIDDINKYAEIRLYNSRFKGYDEDPECQDIVILGFDSMSSRLEAVNIIAMIMKTKPYLLIDGRMGAEHYQQYTFNNLTLRNYKKHWYSDNQGDPEPCSMKATSYCSNMAGSFIVNTIRKVLTEQPYDTNFNFNFPLLRLGK